MTIGTCDRISWVVLLLGAMTSTASAQTGGLYTVGQADTGARVYSRYCATCHMADLSGAFEAPELAGASFQAIWSTRSTNELRTLIQNSMPSPCGRL